MTRALSAAIVLFLASEAFSQFDIHVFPGGNSMRNGRFYQEIGYDGGFTQIDIYTGRGTTFYEPSRAAMAYQYAWAEQIENQTRWIVQRELENARLAAQAQAPVTGGFIPTPENIAYYNAVRKHLLADVPAHGGNPIPKELRNKPFLWWAIFQRDNPGKTPAKYDFIWNNRRDYIKMFEDFHKVKLLPEWKLEHMEID